MIPFNYDYEELWRWATILNRFALSAGNTIGVGGASRPKTAEKLNEFCCLTPRAEQLRLHTLRLTPQSDG